MVPLITGFTVVQMCTDTVYIYQTVLMAGCEYFKLHKLVHLSSVNSLIKISVMDFIKVWAFFPVMSAYCNFNKMLWESKWFEQRKIGLYSVHQTSVNSWDLIKSKFLSPFQLPCTPLSSFPTIFFFWSCNPLCMFTSSEIMELTKIFYFFMLHCVFSWFLYK